MNNFLFYVQKKQITRKDKKKFEHAIKEVKSTLHNSHLHSGFDKKVTITKYL